MQATTIITTHASEPTTNDRARAIADRTEAADTTCRWLIIATPETAGQAAAAARSTTRLSVRVLIDPDLATLNALTVGTLLPAIDTSDREALPSAA